MRWNSFYKGKMCASLEMLVWGGVHSPVHAERNSASPRFVPVIRMPSHTSLYCGSALSIFSTWMVFVFASRVPIIFVFWPTKSRAASCLSRR